ncbi:Glycosyltransferase [Rhynchospora pubera]|uniref:Glycosyltransferase n=1 Tax=Rhynchospora pubera TaxID=906938 RepID=A0AAV8G7M8_9POAL|nr:Glycosyltransferase [Rhynchospora pubera]
MRRIASSGGTRIGKHRHHRAVSSAPTAISGGVASIRRFFIALLLFLGVSFVSSIFYRAGWLTSPFDPMSWRQPQDLGGLIPTDDDSFDFINLDNEDIRLERVLKAASMRDKTVILTTLNAAWTRPGSVIDLFMESLRTGEETSFLLNHLVIVSLDMKAYKRCLAIHTHCFALTSEGVDFSGEKSFMSKGYLRMMWRRIDFLRVVLEKGYSFIFSDADIMWFRNPFPYFYPDADFQMACDHFTGDSSDLRNTANGGFGYVRSNNRTIEFYKFWYISRLNYPGYHDQDVLNYIKYDELIADIGIDMRFLSTTYFGGICEPSRDFEKVCTMHANCCIGMRSKIHDLKVILEEWRYYLSLPPNLKRASVFSWRVPQNCSLDMLNQSRPPSNEIDWR